ncbi:MAG: HAD hydrolase-like protein [Oscillospiraceae bacterium]|nr:HAD hydrolase-like protein [Oscillospiraceae bacterium]
MKYKVILFDLDGTLTDPQQGICRSINYALEHFGAQPKPLCQLTKYIGPPLRDSFAELLGEENAEAAVAKYRERFSVTGLYENEIYPNVKETLELLQQKGYILCTASSKPQIFVEKILKHFEIDKYFSIIGGASLDGKIGEKEDVINLVIKQLSADRKEIVMVGDTRFDLIGAQKMQLDAIGVTYGFGSEQELSRYPHIALISDISHIVNILQQE